MPPLFRKTGHGFTMANHRPAGGPGSRAVVRTWRVKYDGRNTTRAGTSLIVRFTAETLDVRYLDMNIAERIGQAVRRGAGVSDSLQGPHGLDYGRASAKAGGVKPLVAA